MMEINFSDIERKAIELLAKDEWKQTTSDGTYGQFVRYLMLQTPEGKRFDRAFGWKGEGAFLGFVRSGKTKLGGMLQTHGLLDKQGMPINIEDRFAAPKPRPAASIRRISTNALRQNAAWRRGIA